MTCCTYPFAHRHYDDWIRETVISVPCRPVDGSKCGRHPRTWTVNALLVAWRAGH